MSVRNSQTYDHLLLLKDAGAAVAADGVAQVAGQARAIDLGNADAGPVKAIVDTSAVDRVTGDETYRFVVQGSTDAGFTTPVTLGAADITQSGRSEVYFRNSQAGVIYRFVRLFLDVGGTTPSINATAFIARA